MLQELIDDFCGVFGRMIQLVNIDDSAVLGNRAKYIGASDIGKCGEQAVMDKVSKPSHSVKTLVRFLRGHITETIICKALDKTGVHYTTQVEVVHPDYPFILAHIDCILHDKPTLDESTIMVVKEKKSPKALPDEPYDNQVLQVHYQMGLLQIKYPHAEITGTIFNLSVADGEYIDFGPYKPNPTIFASLVEKAKNLMNCMATGALPNAEPSLLCGCCDHKIGCSAYVSDAPPVSNDMAEKVRIYALLRDEKNAIEDQMGIIRDEIIFFTGHRYKNPVGDKVLSISRTADGFALDGKNLKAEQPEIWEKYKKPKSGHVKMEVL